MTDSQELYGVKLHGMLAQMYEQVADTSPDFSVVVSPSLRWEFAGVGSHEDFQRRWDAARDWANELAEGRVPQVSKELRPANQAHAAQAHFVANICRTEPFDDPIPWLMMQKDRGILFQHIQDEVDKILTVRIRRAEVNGLEEKKDDSSPTGSTGAGSP